MAAGMRTTVRCRGRPPPRCACPIAAVAKPSGELCRRAARTVCRHASATRAELVSAASLRRVRRGPALRRATSTPSSTTRSPGSVRRSRAPAQWCDALILHLNVKYCRPVARDQRSVLSVAIGTKRDQPLGSASRVEFAFTHRRVAARLPRCRAQCQQGTARHRQLPHRAAGGGTAEEPHARAPPVFLHVWASRREWRCRRTSRRPPATRSASRRAKTRAIRDRSSSAACVARSSATP